MATGSPNDASPNLSPAEADARAAEEAARRDAERAQEIARHRRRRDPSPGRSPDKQVLVAALAREAWARALADGKITRLGARRYRWNLRPPAAPSGVTIRVLPRPDERAPP